MAVFSKNQSTNLDEQTFRSMYGILQGGMWLLNDLENYLRPFDMSQGRLSILLRILESPGGSIHPAEIAAMTGKSRPTISKMINRLVEDGYVRDLPDTDGRSRKLGITEKGHSLLTSIVPGYNHRVRQMAANLSSSDKHRLIEILSKIDFLDSDKTLGNGMIYTQLFNDIEKLCKTGRAIDIDAVMKILVDADLPTTRAVDLFLGHVEQPEGIERLEYYLFKGSQIQRNYCTLFFARRNDWDLVNEAYRKGLIDHIQAYSR